MSRSTPGESELTSGDTDVSWYAIPGRSVISSSAQGRVLHVAHVVDRYPPALGGAEAYAARLCEYLTGRGDEVRVWTTTAIELQEMWCRNVTPPPTPSPEEGGGSPRPLSRLGKEVGGLGSLVHRYPPLHFPLRCYILKALSLIPVRRWQCLSTPCNPVCPVMWRYSGRDAGRPDAVHATAFPYSFPIMCGLRLARRRGVPYFVTPFLHLGDQSDPHDRIRRQYTAPHLVWLLRQADGVFVQTRAERDAVVSLGVPEARVHLQGLGGDPAECTGGDREAVRSAWGIESDEVVVGHLANNSAEKGTVDLLRAAERAWARGHCFRVVLAGPEMPNFRAFWTGFRPKERVTR